MTDRDIKYYEELSKSYDDAISSGVVFTEVDVTAKDFEDYVISNGKQMKDGGSLSMTKPIAKYKAGQVLNLKGYGKVKILDLAWLTPPMTSRPQYIYDFILKHEDKITKLRRNDFSLYEYEVDMMLADYDMGVDYEKSYEGYVNSGLRATGNPSLSYTSFIKAVNQSIYYGKHPELEIKPTGWAKLSKFAEVYAVYNDDEDKEHNKPIVNAGGDEFAGDIFAEGGGVYDNNKPNNNYCVIGSYSTVNFSPRKEIPPSNTSQTMKMGGHIIHNSNVKDTTILDKTVETQKYNKKYLTGMDMYAEGGVAKKTIKKPVKKTTIKKPKTASYYDIVHSEEFKIWFGDWEKAYAEAGLDFNHKAWEGVSKAVNDLGQPLRVYHGTTHDWTVYNRRLGNHENDMGIGFYATSDLSDAQQNYLAEGQDLNTKIALTAEHIVENKGTTMTKAKKIAEKQYKGKAERIVEVYLNLKNPLIIDTVGLGRKGTNFNFEYTIDEDENYSDSEELIELKDAFDEVCDEFDFSYDTKNRIWSQFMENMGEYDYISAYKVISALKHSEWLYEYTTNDETGGNKAYEFVAQVFRKLGFDGVIYLDASQHFKGMNIGGGTKHLVAYEPNQIKLADGTNTTFSLTNDDIRFDDGGNVNDLDNSDNFNNFTKKITRDELQNILSGKSEVGNGSLIQTISRYLRTGEGTGGKSRKESIDLQEKKLIEFIDNNNLWYTTPLQNYFARGVEQKVYLDESGEYVFKENTCFSYDYKWSKYLDSLLLHNSFFPDTSYQLIGFSRTDKGSLVSVVKQHYVKSTSDTNTDDVEKFLYNKGFISTHPSFNMYQNKELGVILGDLHSANVLTKDNVLYFIDSVFFMEDKNGMFKEGGSVIDEEKKREIRYIPTPPSLRQLHPNTSEDGVINGYTELGAINTEKTSNSNTNIQKIDDIESYFDDEIENSDLCNKLYKEHHEVWDKLDKIEKDVCAVTCEKYSKEIVLMWENDLKAHFVEEERDFFPSVRNESNDSVIEGLVSEHKGIVGLIEKIKKQNKTPDILKFCKLMKSHISKEEKLMLEIAPDPYKDGGQTGIIVVGTASAPVKTDSDTKYFFILKNDVPIFRAKISPDDRTHSAMIDMLDRLSDLHYLLKPVSESEYKAFDYGKVNQAELREFLSHWEHFKNGGEIKHNIVDASFKRNRLLRKDIYEFAEMVKRDYPNVWNKGGVVNGNKTFVKLSRVIERGYWLPNEESLQTERYSYISKHNKTTTLSGVVGMLKYLGVVNEGFAYMKRIIEQDIEREYPTVDEQYKMGGKLDSKICAVGTQVQSLIFSKDEYTEKSAKDWAKVNGYKYGDVDINDSSYRLRQENPSKFVKDIFRTIEFKKGLKAVIACPKTVN